jgi:hypothetical protein
VVDIREGYGPIVLGAPAHHTAATILLLKSVDPKVVSEILDYATIVITLDTYSHVPPICSTARSRHGKGVFVAG